MALLSYREGLSTFSRTPDTGHPPVKSLPQHHYFDFSQLPETYYSFMSDALAVPKLNGQELPQLANVDVGFFTTFAGVGHNRVCTDVATALDCQSNTAALRMKIELDGTLAGKAHHTGSNNPLGKWLTEFTQRNFWAQWMTAGLIHELVLMRDSLPVLSAVDNFLQKSSNSEVMIVAYHQDVAYVLSHYKHQIEQHYQKQLTIVAIMTDHMPERPQFGWYPTYADAIIAPDTGSAQLAREQLAWWNKRFRSNGRTTQLPLVESQPYPINPLLTQYRDPETQIQRQRCLNPKSQEPVAVFIPLGGSAPQQEYLLALSQALPSYFKPQLLFKTSSYTANFQEALNQANIAHEAVDSNRALLSKFIQTFQEKSPEIMITKPSELHALAKLSVDMVGGAIHFYTPPVGDQEVQNVAWLASHGLVPTDQDHQALYQANVAELRRFVPLAHHWRAIKLPNGRHPDPIKAAMFISKLKAAGILEAMMQYQPSPSDSSEISPHGSTRTWHTLNKIQAKVMARRQARQ